MLYPNKLKKAQSDPLKMLIAFIILAIFAAIVIFAIVKPGGKIATEITAMGPSADELCVARSKLNLELDIDGDGRDDYKCDSCVCESGCNNNLRELGGDDSDGDHLPDKCDSVDNDKTKYSFDKTVCPEDKLIELGTSISGTLYKKQCKPTVTIPTPAPAPSPAPATSPTQIT